MELQENLTSILNLIWEVNSRVYQVSLLLKYKDLAGATYYASAVTSVLDSFPERDPQGFFITHSMEITDVEGGEGSMEEKLAC